MTLRTTADGVRMFGEPVKEIEKIHGKTHKVADKPIGQSGWWQRGEKLLVVG